jgi:hypothetical protein
MLFFKASLKIKIPKISGIGIQVIGIGM